MIGTAVNKGKSERTFKAHQHLHVAFRGLFLPHLRAEDGMKDYRDRISGSWSRMVNGQW